MKKSLYKKLVRMARDGDPEAIEAVAEIVEEMTEPEAVPAEEAAEAVAEVAEAVAEDPAAVVETPEGATIVVDEDTLSGVMERLDRIIALLSPAAPAADDDPAEEIAEAVEEALEAVTAEEPAVISEGEEAAEIAELVEEILDPAASVVLTPEGEDECGEEEEDPRPASDALRAALMAVRPALAAMPKKQRRKVCADIASRLRKGKDTGVYAAMAAGCRKPAEDPRELGRRIMEKRNISCRK